MLSFTDTHAHLSMLSHRGIAAEDMLRGLFDSGFGSILDVGTEAGDLEGRIGAFSGFPNIRFSAGIWPSQEAISNRGEEFGKLKASIARADARALVAVGECGIDRHWNRAEGGADIEGERELFLAQARLAAELGLPLIVHSREAAEETAQTMAQVAGLRGVIHCFSYGKREARRFLDLGLYISFSGTITYKNAQDLREAVAYVSGDRILLETDSPYLSPLPFRGKSAVPGMIEKTYEAAAAVRGTTTEELAETAARNAFSLFSLPTRF